MAKCDVCGNDYDSSFQVMQGGKTWTFDSFECAIHACAPHCSRCDLRIIGHGVQKGVKIYCCASCAHVEGALELHDRAS